MGLPKGTKVPLSGPMQKAAALAAKGLSTQQIADELGVHRATISRWFQREDIKAIRTAALTEVCQAMLPRAYAVLHNQLNHENPWVAQNAARELIRLHNLQQGQADNNVVVTFGAMPKPGAPASAGGVVLQQGDGDQIDTDFAD